GGRGRLLMRRLLAFLGEAPHFDQLKLEGSQALFQLRKDRVAGVVDVSGRRVLFGFTHKVLSTRLESPNQPRTQGLAGRPVEIPRRLGAFAERTGRQVRKN